MIFVIIFAQVMLPIGALVAAVQPTPQLAQATAQELGLGDWLAARAGDLIAWAQPLWGEPKTAAAQSDAPGGVSASGLYWFKADNPAATTTTWPDAFANGYNTTAATAVTLNTSTNLANFNPTYTFNGTNNRFTTTAITYSPNSTNGDEVFAVTYVTNSSATDHEVAHFGKQATSTTQWEFDIWQGNIEFGAGDPYGAAVSSANIPNTSWSILNANRQGTGAIASVYQENLNGLTVPFGTNQGPNANYIGGFDQFTIGARRYNGNFDTWYQGQLAEVIGYSRKLSTTERQQVSSYLAVKYGITQGSTASPVNYLNSVGATIWTGSATYQNHVFGIGKDAGSALEQQIAAAQYPTGDIITIATDNNFTGANGSHTAIANDQFFFLVGNNGGSTSYTAKTGLSNGLNAILNRVWKVEQTGTAQDLYLKTSNSQATYLLYSTDATFSTGVTYAALTSGATAGLQIPNGNYFTFATTTAPPVLQSLTSTTADGAYTNGDQIAICANYDQALAAGSTLNVTLDTGATLTLTHVDASLGGTISVDGSYAIGTGANNVVYALALQSDEKAVIGGQFTTYNGTTRTRIARINSDGTLDTSFDPGTGLNNYPEAILMQPDGKILIAGNFTTVNGTSRTYLARLNSDGSLDTSFNTTLNNVVYAMALQADGKIVIGGQFSTVNGTGRTRLARVNSDGTLDTSFDPGTGLNNYPEALLVRPDGKVLMAGNFTTVNGTSRAYLGLLNSDGTLDTSFTPTLNNVVYAMTRQSDGKLVISGAFSTVNSTGRTRLARLNADGTLDSGFDPGTGLNNYAESIIVQSDNKLLLGGNFTTVNGTSRAYLARVNADGAVDTTFAPGTGANNVVYALGLQSDGKVVSGGAFTSFNGTSQNRLTRLNGDANNAASADQQACGTYTVLPGHNSNDLTVSAITSANVIATTGDTSTATTIPSGENLADNAALVIAGSAPGGVTTNLAWWFQGNRGVQTSGTAVTQWNDSNVALNVSQATAANQPTASKSQNFNPIVTFDGSNDYLSNSAGYWKATTSNNQYDTFVVSTNQNTGGVNAVFGESTSAGTQMMFLPYSGNAYNGFWNSYTSSNNQIGTTGTPYLWSGRFNNSSTPKVNAISQNGKQLAGSTSTAAFNGSSSALYLGAHQPNNWYYNGDVAEVALYATDLSATQRQQVLSYLALKWGLTLDQTTATDYLASDGTTQMWSSSANSGYANNIAGIGRDLNAGLNQKQSQSVNSGTQVVIGLGEIAASNAANANSFAADKSFLTWGDNGQATTFGVSYSPTSFTPVAGYYRMSRVWKVQESGTITDVVVFTGKGEHLLVSNDPTFATGVTEIALTSGSATVDLSNGQYFTFGNTLYAPGGVATNLNRWYRADAGVTTATGVAQWADQSQNEVSVTQGTTANQPVYNTASNLLNFNPSLTFDGSNDRLNNTSGGVAFGTGGYTAYYVASNTTPSASKYVLGFGVAGNLNGFNSGSAATATSKTSGGTTFVTETNAWTAAIANLTRTGFTGGATQPYYLASNGGAESTSSNVSPNVTDLNLAIGARPDGAGNYWQGNIAEVVLYSGKQTATDYNKVESYLALKYGITKAGNYVNTVAATVWDATANSGYANNIAGIGRDDAAALHQQIATSQAATGDIVTLSTDNNFTGANGTHASISNDLFYFMVGNNGGTTGYSAKSGLANGLNAIMNRVWKVQQTGTAQNVFIKTTDAKANYLLYSSDPTFSSGVTYVALTNFATGGIQIPSGNYFTFAMQTKYPGGVTGARLWYRADLGVTPNGSNVSGWLNFGTANGYDATQATGSLQPPYYTSSNLINFNPTIGFSNHYLKTASGGDNLASTSNTAFVLAKHNSTAASQEYIGGYYSSNLQYTFEYRISDNSSLGYEFGKLSVYSPSNWRSQYTSSSAKDLNINIIDVVANGGSSTASFNKNGSSVSTTVSGFTNPPNINTVAIGARGTDGSSQSNDYRLNANMSEVIEFGSALSATDRTRVQTYLAVKYGLTLGSTSSPVSYLATDGSTVVWTGSSTYQNNVIGIAREDGEALHQQIATSQDATTDIITISTDSNFTGANGTHTAIANDQFYFMAGNNGGATTYASKSGLSNGLNAIMNRVWKVQQTGTAQDVYIKTSNGNATYLIYSADATFSTSVTYVALSAGVTSGIQIPSGNYFTFAAYLTGPGGVVGSGLYWFRADNAGATTTFWPDYFANGYDVTAPAAVTLNTASNLANFNPNYTFNGSSNRFSTNSINYSSNSTTGEDVFAVTYVTNSGSTNHAIAEFGRQASSADVLDFNIDAGKINSGSGNVPYASAQSVSTIPNTSWSIINGNRQGTGLVSSVYQLNLNGLNAPHTTYQGPNAVYLSNFDFFGIGARRHNAGFDTWYNGQLAEVIGYSRKLSNTERQQVSSYLAVKYGITLGSTASPVDYLNSAGTTIWTGSATYQNQVFGIGKDAGSALEQRISAAQYPSGDIVTISTDSNFTNTNGLHTAIASDLAYLVIGNNNGAATYATTNVAAGYHRRITRQWLAQNTNFAQNVYLQFSGFGSDTDITYYLVKRNGNSDLTTGITQVTALDADGVTASPVTLASGDYFTVMGSGLDSDGDGVADIDDLDDDNDGILDTAEGYQCTFAGTWNNKIAWDVEHDVSDGNVGTYFTGRPATSAYGAGTINSGSDGWNWSFPAGSPASNGGISWQFTSWSNNGSIADAFDKEHYVEGKFYVSGTADLQAGGFSQWAGGHAFPFAILISTDPTFATYDQLYNGLKPTAGSNTMTPFDHPIIFTSGFTYYIRVVFPGSWPSTSAWDSLYLWYDPADGNATNCGSALDTDGDSIVNQLDLDSDGDACPDATEGGTHFTSLSASSLPGGNSGAGYTGPSSTPVTENLGNTVASNGVPTVAGSGQSAAGSASTLANSCYAPGGITSNLARWYRADQSVTTATGAASWVDYMNAVELTQGTATNQPVYNTTSNLLNYNPSLTFDGANDRLNNTSGGVAFGTGGYTAYYVASNTTPSASKYVLGFGVSANLNGFNSGAASTATSKTSGGATFVTQTSQWTAGIANLTRTGFTGGATQEAAPVAVVTL